MSTSVIRPNTMHYYVTILTSIMNCSRAWRADPDSLEVWLGQSPDCTGQRNNYEIRGPVPGQVERFNGNGKPLRGGVSRHLLGPYSREQIRAWMQACPDWNAPTAHRVPSPVPPAAP